MTFSPLLPNMSVKALIYTVVIIAVSVVVLVLVRTIKHRDATIRQLGEQIAAKDECINKARADIEALKSHMEKEITACETHGKSIIEAAKDYDEKIGNIEKISQDRDVSIWLDQPVPDAVLYCEPAGTADRIH